MARSHSSYTASPTRYRSPQHSPARGPTSEDGSQYEMDLDVLGLNSSFDSNGDPLNGPDIDVVDTSDIEGPEDFTMNMTYWMTADLPFPPIKSRKEASARVEDMRGDARQEEKTDAQDFTEEGDKAVIDDTARDRALSEAVNSASPTMRANGTVDGSEDDNGLNDSSMENEEKVMSYLSALPDTDLPGAITSTPLKISKGNLLQVPTPAGSKARSLQPTVEDYDTPRKVTQETVIRHVLEPTTQTEDMDDNALQDQIEELQARLDQRELASKTRITELETILSYTRSELDAARTENYKRKEQIADLDDEGGRRERGLPSDIDVDAQIKNKERQLEARMQEFGEELRLQHLSRLQNQREDFERQLRESEEAKRAVDEQVEQKDQLLAQLRSDLEKLQQSKLQEIQSIKDAHSTEQQQHDQNIAKQQQSVNEKLSAIQTRAENLQAALVKATADAQAAREETAATEARASHTQDLTVPTTHESYTNRISDLESHNQYLKSQLESSRADASSKDQQLLRDIEEQERLEQRLNSAQGRIDGLETTISTLRQHLADAHRESSKARTDVERLEKDLEEWSERLEDAKREAGRRVLDVEKKLQKMKELKTDAEMRFKELQSQHESQVEEHEAQLDNVRSSAEDAVRKVGAMLELERKEKRRLAKDLKISRAELERMRAEAAKKVTEEDESETETSIISSHVDSKDAEIENLRTLLRKQASEMKTLKSETATLRKKTQSLAANQAELETLRYENETLKSHNATLQSQVETQRSDFEAVNRAMDERLATTLSKMLKERSRAVVGKRDDQWSENIGKLQGEKEFMGKVLMREWGRQECGVAEEKENQVYQYQYVKRS